MSSKVDANRIYARALYTVVEFLLSSRVAMTSDKVRKVVELQLTESDRTIEFTKNLLEGFE